MWVIQIVRVINDSYTNTLEPDKRTFLPLYLVLAQRKKNSLKNETAEVGRMSGSC